jgi:membrane protease YdiL (CAAX protease family)
MTARNRSLTVPLLLAVIAPMSVIVGIDVVHSVWWVFVTYQVSICLLAPWIESRASGRSWREHLTLIGLRGARSGKLAVVLSLLTILVTGGFLMLTRDRFLDANRITTALTKWGVSNDNILTLLIIMGVLNAAAEELFWRGYFPGRVQLARPNAPAALTVVLPSFLYASYHAATIGKLVGNTTGVVLMTGGVLAAGLFWGWLRRRTNCVWPALLSHSGAVAAYLAVHLWLTRR